MQIVTVSYTSYFDEAVTGLEVGSPVRFRGVKIGNVSAIDVAPDRRHVEVTYRSGVEVLKRLGLAGASEGKKTKISLPPDLRVQIASTGVTGTKYLQIDFFDTEGAPPPLLPFPVPENYIPAIPSTMKNLEDAVVRAVDQIPEITRGRGLRRDRQGQPHPRRRGPAGPARQGRDDARRDPPPAGAPAGRARPGPGGRALARRDGGVKGANAALARMDRVLERLDGNDGMLASVSGPPIRWATWTGRGSGEPVETARDLREAAVAVRQLVEALQRDPDMLLKGKAKVRP